MGNEAVIKKFFPVLYTEVEFVKETYSRLKDLGFSFDNSIAVTCICRDEISQTLRSIVKHVWGEAFNLSSLGGMFFAGQTGLMAAMHHSPNIDGRERYVFFSMPHIAISTSGQLGVCSRQGRSGDSIACGALNAFQKELSSGKLDLSMDEIDIEQSLLKRRLLREIPYGDVPDLLELTKLARSVIQKDIEHALNTIIDRHTSDYAVLSGIQINGSENNYINPVTCYAVVNGVKEDILLG
jgi:Limiting CO2-inducible proteins B/C beta carbonyic anhydrases